MPTTIPRTLVYLNLKGEEERLTDAALLEAPVPMVVLGEPGMGKTTLLERLGDQLGHRYITARAFLRQARPETTASGGVFVIDALDEVASAGEQDPINAVLAQLAAAGHPPFVLSCRSADWQGALGRQDIIAEYAREPLVLTLEPISAAAAIGFATESLDRARAEDLIAELQARSLHGLYGNPLTLGLVCKVVKAEGRLPKTSYDLFEKSCDLLRREDNQAHNRSRLANLTAGAFFDSAGAACAALLVTGAESLSLEAPGALGPSDIHIAEVEALPGGANIRAALSSKLFVRKRDGDRFGVLHKVIAEFLGARWLAALPPSVSRTRVFSLIAPDGGPPASLRGLHAWLSAYGDVHAHEVIERDPYGVLRYADPTRLSDGSVVRLLEALRQLSVEDPRFRSSDWRRQIAPGLARPALVRDLDRLITDRSTEFQFRMLLLEALEGQPVAADLAASLERILVTDGPQPFYFAERRAAADALVGAPGLILDWPMLLRPLQSRKGEDSRRLVVELITRIGPDRFPARQIAEASLSYLNLMPGQTSSSERSNTVGVLYLLAKATPPALAAAALDEIVSINPQPGRGRDWETRWGLAELIDDLVLSALKAERPGADRLLGWLRLTRERDGYRRGREAIQAVFQKDAELRRAVLHEALIVSRSHDTLWERYWRLADLNNGLNPSPEDLAFLIGKGDLDPAKPDDREQLSDLVRIGRSETGVIETVLNAALPLAARDPAFAAFLEDIRQVREPEWKKAEKERQRRNTAEKLKRWSAQRAKFETLQDELAAGAVSASYTPAQAYLGRFWDVANAAPPRDRVREWLGPELSDLALQGFEATLHRNDLPSPEAVAVSYAQDRRWYVLLPLLAGLLERVRDGRTLDDLRDDVLITARMALLREHVDADTGGEMLDRALTNWFASRPSAVERFVRLMIEPQLREGGPHVAGLYQLVRKERPRALKVLVPEWLATFPDMERTAEYEFVRHLLREGDVDALAQACERRRGLGYQDDDHALSWLGLGFVLDFAANQEALAAAAADPALLAHIRTWRSASRDDGVARLPTSLDALAWLIDTFRLQFPTTYRSSGRVRDIENSEAADSTQFLFGVIEEIAADLSDEALAIMDRLRAAPEDGYSEMIRSARTQQIVARRERDFTPPTLKGLRTVAAEGPPITVPDLQAVALDALARVQAQIRGDDLESASLFYENGAPRDENGCRDRLGVLLRGVLPAGIDIIPERQAPRRTRADLVFTLGLLHLPVEAKGQWHSELWSAAQTQLDHHYTRDWRAEASGIYLVFWFGPDVPKSRKLKSCKRGTKRPQSPEALRDALTVNIPQHRRAALSVVVLDLTRPA